MIRIATLATPAALPFLGRIVSLKREFWDYSAASQRDWFYEHVAQGDLHVIASNDDDAVIGYTRLALEDEGSSIALIDTLCVRRSEQGRGIGLMVMRAANDAIFNEGRTGLLSCSAALVPFYRRCGWSRVASSSLRPDEITMQLIKADDAIPAVP
jgi:predicted GNAT family N-acyltransferase